MTRALVLGGGGVAGIAWATGIAAGLARQGVDIAQADVVIGTSAGSVVGAQLACGAEPEALLAQQLAPPAASREQAQAYSQKEANARNRALMDKVDGDLTAARKRIGAHALRSAAVPLAQRREIISARLPQAAWPARALRVVAVDTATGAHTVFDRDSGADFTDAIAASCAVPGAWPAVPIDGRAWMDGGIRSLSNADLAAPAQCVLVIAPLGYADDNPVSGHLRAEVRMLEDAGARVAVVVPDSYSARAMTDNLLDPTRRAPSARAGLVQALRMAQDIAAFWNAGVSGADSERR